MQKHLPEWPEHGGENGSSPPYRSTVLFRVLFVCREKSATFCLVDKAFRRRAKKSKQTGGSRHEKTIKGGLLVPLVFFIFREVILHYKDRFRAIDFTAAGVVVSLLLNTCLLP